MAEPEFLQRRALVCARSRMGNILGGWREQGKLAVITLLAACAVAYLHHPQYAAQAAHVQE